MIPAGWRSNVIKFTKDMALTVTTGNLSAYNCMNISVKIEHINKEEIPLCEAAERMLRTWRLLYATIVSTMAVALSQLLSGSLQSNFLTPLRFFSWLQLRLPDLNASLVESWKGALPPYQISPTGQQTCIPVSARPNKHHPMHQTGWNTAASTRVCGTQIPEQPSSSQLLVETLFIDPPQ